MTVDGVERRLSLSFPARLRRLYAEADGRWSEPGKWWVVWPLARLAEDNEQAWANGTLPSHLLAFGDDGTGNPFCVPLTSEADQVLRWNWLDQDVEMNEGSLEYFSRAWLNGK